MVVIQLFTMHKSRNLSEKKRRDQFNMLINELCSMVTSNSRKMDKSSVLRATISFLRNHNELSVQSQSVKVQENWKPSFLSNEEFTHLMLEALDGFIIVFSCNGQILYTSESTASLLGYLPSRIYSSVFDIIHEVDKSSLYKLISNAPTTSSNSLSKDSFVKILLHMKRGPVHSQGSNSYELVQLLGTFYHWPSSYEGPNPASFDCDSNSCSSICSMPTGGVEIRSCFVAVGRLQTPHLLRIVNLSDDAKNEFTSRHSLEWKFLFLDHRAPPIIGYLPFEVLGTSGYDYYHVEDLDKISTSHELLMQTGEGTSCFYRFLTKGQQWIWLQTRYYISYHQWNSKPEFIVCTHTVVSTEKVLKSLQETPKRFSKNTSSLDLPHASATPSQSACLSPSPSASSLGSMSSEHSEQCSTKASSTSTRVNTVLYSNKQRREMASPVSRAFHSAHPMLPENFVEPQHPISNFHQSSQVIVDTSAAISSSDPVTMPSQERSDLSRQLSSESVPLVSHSPSLMLNNEDHVQQSPNERLAPPMNQAHLQEYLRRRHQMLQQQIRLQQEELRRVSEQLMYVQFVQPPPPTHSNVPYQVSGVTTMPSYVNTYSVVQPGPSMPPPMSEESVIIKNLDSYSRPTQSSPSTSRTYMNLEPGMCGASTNAMPHISVEQNNEALAQSYSMTHPMPPNS
ncbi:neuronal PAS domain-containing protein 2 isoform X2 [Parasteatoda tepidariorum]|uniref:neuronal PAS domain-containing protein 2 isoform X2 n=1 Tax=Parasteatoda tepidariorum TaxID=114398 RepID=UPI00077FAB37|nr:neuronal PAS domain-containing protein 2 isoform X2 [Parasteatoda tepidariorum]XP_042904100.1 neuronal PAS domain-containing protein 2 isoform X2 [Parasteatoda tepidariorum]